jgi:hypothetical protein
MDHIERLVSLANVWCAVEFLHPYLAYRRDIDWDLALVHALPKVLAADTTETFAYAVRVMLDVLGDPVSRVQALKPENRTPAPDAPPLSCETDDEVLVVSFGDVGEWDTVVKELRALQSRLAQTRGIVFDMRGSPNADFCVNFSGLDRKLSTTLIAGPGQRSRVHAGLVPQGIATSGGYYSALQTADGNVFMPHEDARDVPCVFIVDREPNAPAVALALQRAGTAAIMVEGEADDGAFVRRRLIDIGDGLQAQLRVSEIVYRDGCGGFEPDLSLPASAGRDALVRAALGWLASPRTHIVEGKPLPAVAESPPQRDHDGLSAARASSARRIPDLGHPPLLLPLQGADRGGLARRATRVPAAV